MMVQDFSTLEGAGRRSVIKGAIIGTMAALAGGIGEARAAGLVPKHPVWRIVFINHATTNPFNTAVQYGIRDAAALMGCTTQWTGSERSIAAEMVNAMNEAIVSKADAIFVSLVDRHAFNEPVQRALDAGIPTFAFNADVTPAEGNNRLAYVGQDLFKAGQLMGEKLVQLVDSGRIALFIATPGQLNIQPRLDGAMDVLKKSGKNYKIDVVATGVNVNEEFSRVKSYYLGHQDVKGMLSVDAGTTEGIAQCMVQYGLAAKGVHGGGIDVLPITLDAINRGAMDFAIDQQAYLQGYYSVTEAYIYLMSGGLVGPADINTGTKYVTKQNVGPYLATHTRYEGTSTTPQVVPRSGPIKS